MDHPLTHSAPRCASARAAPCGLASRRGPVGRAFESRRDHQVIPSLAPLARPAAPAACCPESATIQAGAGPWSLRRPHSWRRWGAGSEHWPSPRSARSCRRNR